MPIYLITSQEIKDNTSMGGNVDPDKYIHFINDIQVTVLEPILGTALYDKILADFDSSSLAYPQNAGYDCHIWGADLGDYSFKNTSGHGT